MELYTDILLPIFQKTEQIDTLMRKKYGTVLNNYTISEMHCIDYIKKIKKPNVTKLALSLNISKAGTSKIIKHLLAKKNIKKYTETNNKKEIYYSLTDTGEKIFAAHLLLHKRWGKYANQFLKTISPEEIHTTITTLHSYTEYLENILQRLERNNKNGTSSHTERT